jgi:hypothetical protein
VLPLADFMFGTLLLPAKEHIASPDRVQGARQVGLLLWSPTGRPVAPSRTPVRRNPEHEPPAKAGV